MYFDRFAKIQYNGKLATNITQSILLKYKTMYNTTLWQFHTIVDGETPQSVADKYYGDAKDAWIILLINNIVDPFTDWALGSHELNALAKSKYGDANVGKVHHLVDSTTGKWVSPGVAKDYVNNSGEVYRVLPQNYTPVTNIEYENGLNDVKRDIKILAPKYIQSFKNQFDDEMRIKNA